MQLYIRLLSQMKARNNPFRLVPVTADRSDYSQTQRTAGGIERMRFKIKIQC